MIAKPDKERINSRHISFINMDAKSLNIILANSIQHYLEKEHLIKVNLFQEWMV